VQDDGQLADGHDARAICIVLSNVSYVEDAAKLARKTSARAQLVRKLRTLFAVRPSWPFFMSPRDIGLFVRSARTDRAIGRMRRQHGSRAAFEAAYVATSDPWGSASLRYGYQRRKYDHIVALLPSRQFRHALDLGCGLGLLSQRLTARADETLGLDVADAAIKLARAYAKGVSGLTFAQADLMDLPRELNRRFDLVVIADTLYYLSPLDNELLKMLAGRIADLLAPGGICLIADHFFFSVDLDSRISRRIHDAFSCSPRFSVISHHRQPFFLVTVLEERALVDARGSL
jgi:SAM-dependent methyltransferase